MHEHCVYATFFVHNTHAFWDVPYSYGCKMWHSAVNLHHIAKEWLCSCEIADAISQMHYLSVINPIAVATCIFCISAMINSLHRYDDFDAHDVFRYAQYALL